MFLRAELSRPPVPAQLGQLLKQLGNADAARVSFGHGSAQGLAGLTVPNPIEVGVTLPKQLLDMLA